MNDFRFAFRQLIKNPGFTLVAVVTLALGVGANTAIFSVVNGLLLKPLPFHDPKALVWIANTGSGGLSGVTTTVANFKDWRQMNHSFQEMGAYFAFFDYGGYSLSGTGEPERLRGVGVSRNFLNVLGVRPLLGRNFAEEECQTVAPKAVLLTHGFWQRRFAADPTIVGRSITLNNQPTTVVGVLPATFDFTSIFTPGTRVDFVLPFPLTDETDHWGNTLAVIGRLKPGVTIAAAQSEFNLLNAQLHTSHPERGRGFGAKLSGLPEQINGRFWRPFVVLFCAVGCVLLIACANLSNLLLARAVARRKEVAVRMALGARRSQLIRQMLTESVVLASCGALAGLPLAYAATRALASSRAFAIPLLATVTVDGRALIFTLVVAVATGLLFGAAPALQLSAADVQETLKDAGRGSSGGRRRAWLRGSLVVSEIALACVLLVGAGLLIRSFNRLLDVDPGFRPERAVAWRLEINRQFADAAAQNAFYDQLARRIEALPGVESVGLTDTLPLGRNRSWGVGAKGESYAPGEYPNAFPRIVDAGYIKTMRIPLRAGREFDPHDLATTEKVMVVNETMARRLWPGRDAVGQIAKIGGEFRVIGVVGDVRHSGLDEAAGLEMYLLGSQLGWGATELVVRTKQEPGTLVPAVRAALKELDSQLPTADYKLLTELIDQAVSPKRLIVLLLGGFSVLAMVLAALGIYGVLAYSVSQRTQEIGIRLAIGSPAAKVVKMVIGEGLGLAVLGIGIGVVASLALTRALRGLLFEVSATDPLTFVFNAAMLLAVAFLACWLPARRAARVDPMVALRHE